MTAPDGSLQETRSGIVAVIGAPNAGKSTLINTLVGDKVSIVSPKAQTTRTVVRGIAIHDNAQIVFVDTPGLFAPKKRLERAMVAAAWSSAEEADLVMLVYDSTKPEPGRDAGRILEGLEKAETRTPCLLVLNKTDQVRPPALLNLAQKLNEKYDFAATFMVSAKKASGTADILGYLAARLPPGPWLYPEDQVSDMPMRLLAAEITREKLFHKLHDELPYGLAVETESWEEREDGSILIHQVVFVARESHKPIVLGKGGRLIKAVGTEARMELEEITERKIHLKLFVKVNPRWEDDPAHYAAWGLEFGSR